MEIVAHRGGSITTPENSLSAFANAQAMGAPITELDVQLSSDGVLVLMHDITVDRTTNASGPVCMFTAEELASLDLGNGEGVPTLRQVLDLAAGKQLVRIEIKVAEACEPMITLVQQYDDLRWVGLSTVPGVMDAMRQALPHCELLMSAMPSREAFLRLIDHVEASEGIIDPQQIKDLRATAEDYSLEKAMDEADRLRAGMLSIHYAGLTEEIVKQVHDRGLMVGAWTVNDPDRAAELMAMGVDTLTTDDPATMLDLVRSTAAR